MSVVFPENSKNCPNHDLVKGGCNVKTHITDQVISVTNNLQIIWNLFYRKIMFIIHVLSAIEVFSKTPEKNFDRPTLVTPTYRPGYIFSPEFTLCKKSQLSIIKNRPITPGSWYPRVCSSRNRCIINIIYITKFYLQNCIHL